MVLPFFGFGIKVVVAPKFLHHFLSSNTKLLGIGFGKSSGGEGPTEES